MTTQEYILILIGLIILVIVGRRVTKLFEKKSSPCDGCSGCEVSAHHQDKTCG